MGIDDYKLEELHADLLGDQDWVAGVTSEAYERLYRLAERQESELQAQAKEIRAQALDEARAAIEGQRLTDNTGQVDDLAYNQAIDDALGAIGGSSE